MKLISIQECTEVIEKMIPKLMKSIQFTTLKELFGLGLDITLSQFYVFAAIFHDEGSAMSALADRLLLKPASITGLIERLEKQALVERRHESTDRRVVTVWLTDRGRKYFHRFQEKKNEYLQAILNKVGEENRQNLVRSLRALDQAVEQIFEERNQQNYEQA
jgi:DNA-binding MarR family transcriptional regulator